MGFGNQLYLWAWAHAHRDEKPAPRVLVVDKMRYWIPYFPAVRPWLVEQPDVGMLDQRAHHWSDPLVHSGDPRGFSDESRAAFIRDWLLTSPALSAIADSELASPDVLTLNVRRGDYYSNEHHRPEFAIDLAAYLEIAVSSALEADGPARRVPMVSDDVDWCRQSLVGCRGSPRRSPTPVRLTDPSTTSATSARHEGWSSPTPPSRSGVPPSPVSPLVTPRSGRRRSSSAATGRAGATSTTSSGTSSITCQAVGSRSGCSLATR